MIQTTTKRWSFATAQTDLKIQDVSATQRMVVVYAKATIGNSATVDVSVEVGLGTTTLPTVADDSATGGTGVFLSHAGIAKGGGVVESNGGAPICVGAPGEDLRVTCSAATSSKLRLVVVYWIDELAE